MLFALRAFIEFMAAHPYLAHGLVLVAALVQVVPVARVVVSGSVTIIAMSALVPTGALSPWPLLLSAILGAVAGDGVSYWLGRRYGRDILRRSPFNRYPQLVARSADFLHRRGGRSILFGRLTPVLRAFVPLFAGITNMTALRFHVSSLLSAMAWAGAHVLPGVILGASLVLAGAVAARFAAFAVTLLVLLWLVAWAARWLLRRGPKFLGAVQTRLELWARRRDGWIRRQLLALLDPARTETRALAIAAALLVGAVWVFLGILEDVASGDPLVRADAAVYALLQNLRTAPGDALMVAVTELGDSPVVIAVTIAVLLWLVWQRAWRSAAYWVAAVSLASAFNTAVKVSLTRARPAEDLYSGWSAFSFPSGHSTVNAVMYGFLAFLVARELRLARRLPLIIGAAAFIMLIAFSRLYLGAHWFSDVAGGLAFGTAWMTLLAIAYLHHRPQRIGRRGLLIVAGATLAAAGSTNIYVRHGADMARYAVREETRILAASEWSAGRWRDLPANRIDLEGKLEEPLTVQWVGDLPDLENRLLQAGWHVPPSWTARAAASWLAPDPDPLALPVMPLLHDGRAPALTLVQAQSNDARLVLRLWATAVEVTDDRGSPQPLWIGAAVEERLHRPLQLVTVSSAAPDANTPRDFLASSLGQGNLIPRDNVMPSESWDAQILLLR